MKVHLNVPHDELTGKEDVAEVQRQSDSTEQSEWDRQGEPHFWARGVEGVFGVLVRDGAADEERLCRIRWHSAWSRSPSSSGIQL